MKSDTERKIYYTEKIHKKKNRLHAHLSKDLRSRAKIKTRAFSIRKGDTVKVMRGPGKGKEAKISDINIIRRKVFLEGVNVRNARGREVPVALEASNLLLLSFESTPERKKMFSDEAFRKKETPKKEAPKSEQKSEIITSAGAKEVPKEHSAKSEHVFKTETKEGSKPEHKTESHKTEHTESHKNEHKPNTVSVSKQENVQK